MAPRYILAWAAAITLTWTLATHPSLADSPTKPSTPSTAPPNQSAFSGARATAWSEDAAHMLFLNGDTRIRIAGYDLTADRALVRITPHHANDHSDNQVSQDVTVYLDRAVVNSPKGRVRSQSPRLLVTANLAGPIALTTDLLRHDQPPSDDPFLTDARLALAANDAAPPDQPQPTPPPTFAPTTEPNAPPTSNSTPTSTSPPTPPRENTTQDPATPPPEWKPLAKAESLPGGLPGGVSFFADKVIWRKDDGGRNLVVLTGGIGLEYHDRAKNRVVTLTADQAVIFLKDSSDNGDPIPAQNLDAGQVDGVYLEDNVTLTDSQYTIRAPRVFYDLATDQAVVLDAVLYTWSVKRQIPIYIRAKMLRQKSRQSWQAKDARLTTSEFARPHFAIGANELTISSLRPASSPSTASGGGVTSGGSGGPGGTSGGTSGGAPQFPFEAKGLTMRWNDLPLFYWPKVAGNADAAQGLPLRRFDGKWTQNDGPIVTSAWDLFALAGRQPPTGVTLTGDLDYLGDHGPAMGLSLDYDLPRMFGTTQAYLLPNDQADDEIGDRDPIGFDGDARGFALWRHRQLHRQGWDLSLELAYVSDETFLDSLFSDEADLSKPYETSLYLKKQKDDWALDFLVQHDFLDFTAQTAQLQSPGFTTLTQPQLGYYRVGTSLWNNRLTYYTETRLSRVQLRFGDDRPDSHGFTAAQSLLLFGQPTTLEFEERAQALGLPTDHRLRADTRHELQMPTEVGPFNVVPYLTGRITAYNDDFSEFSGDDEKVRFWGLSGIRLHTQVSRVFDDVDSPLWDLHRLRHLVEPSLDAFWAGSTLNPEDLPVFNHDVEAIREGLGLRLGLRNTFQTQRGGPGPTHSVDWFTWDSAAVFRGDDADLQTPIANFFSYRPEFSVGGDHLENQWTWQVSETLAAVGQWTFSLERDRTVQWRVGATLRHTPDLSSFMDYAVIDPLSSRLLTYGLTYKLTTKYDLSVTHTLDLSAQDTRDIHVKLERRLPGWRMQVVAKFDGIDDETTVGLILIPDGLKEGDNQGPSVSARGWVRSDARP